MIPHGKNTINSIVEVILMMRELKTVKEVNLTILLRIEEVYLTAYWLAEYTFTHLII